MLSRETGSAPTLQHRSLFIKLLQTSRLWSPQTCHFLQRSPSMTSQLGGKCLMKWRRSADQTMSPPVSRHSYLITVCRERERECYMLRPWWLEVWLLLRSVWVLDCTNTVQRLSGPQVCAGDKTAGLYSDIHTTPITTEITTIKHCWIIYCQILSPPFIEQISPRPPCVRNISPTAGSSWYFEGVLSSVKQTEKMVTFIKF